ncbi:ATP-binding protein [Microbacterium lacticum]|uniref:ATP-binding protein n=1 Tax=Microbacterium lacticum TaxID=33885 RepID=UPI003A86F7F1
MTSTLFSALDAPAESHQRTGYRLQTVEVFNWGTFDKHVWNLRLDSQTSLLTGDIGSGKSTLVDAVTTLLLPAHRIAYNKAAGADVKERTLRSYVEGHYKSERNEATGASRPVGLRDHRSYSVILGVFANEGYGEQITIAQVFHQKDRTGQPDRFFVTASAALSIDPDFTAFGSDLKALRSRLRAGGADIDNTFPDYHRRVRRLLGIRSEQAMELFHQTVSMKSVGNLNDFVRDHMLEPVDAAPKVKAIVDHFENLVKAHEAVRTAIDQLAVLAPLVAAGDRYDDAAARHAGLTDQRSAVVPYLAERVRELLDGEIGVREGEVTALESQRADVDRRRADLVPIRDRLKLERAGVGGDRLKELDVEIPRAGLERDSRADRRRKYDALLQGAQLAPVEDAADFLSRSEEAQLLRGRLDERLGALKDRRDPLFVQRTDLRRSRTAAQEEIDRLRDGRSNVGRDLDRVRAALCDALDLDTDELPFAGELLDVRETHAQWRGAAERVLRGFALSLLVSQEHYAAVSEWVNDHRLGARLVYLRVPERRVRSIPTARSGRRLIDVIDVESGAFADYVVAELASRADHVLAESVEELRREERAVTREGLVRDRDRHEKDDRRSALDPRAWVLGRATEQKIAALTEERDRHDDDLARIDREFEVVDADAATLAGLGRALTGLEQYGAWREIDTAEASAQLTALETERERLIAGSSALVEIDRQLAEIDEQDAGLRAEADAATQRLGAARADVVAMRARDDAERTALEALGPDIVARAREHYPALADRVTRAEVRTVEDCDRLRASLTGALTAAIEAAQREMNGYTTGIQQQMSEFLRRWPDQRSELDASVRAIAGFRELHTRVLRDDLPRYEEEFRHQLNTNAVRELAQFNAWLRRQADEIRGRVDVINEALAAIDYNPGRIIVLVAEPTVNQEVRQFRADLRDATADLLAEAGDGTAEARFEQIRLLIERLQGRVGHADSDRAWIRRVTDVRNWFTFAASEQDRQTGEEFEHYTDSDGKSGGQKEKLAYTILAASLAYQFGLEWGVEKSRDFRFAVIDEAFGRGSDASTRYALELFAKLGLQLLIVTPLQKVHVIERYVSAIAFVDNPTGAASRVQTLTIEEFRERQRSRG